MSEETGANAGAAGSATGAAGSAGSGAGAQGAGASAGGQATGSAGASGSAGAGASSDAGASGAGAGTSGGAAGAGAGAAHGGPGGAGGSPGAGSSEGAAKAGAGEMWGADWREQYSKDDPAKLNALKRYTSPGAALDALFEAQNKIRSGQAKQALPENPSAEQIAAYRQANGIPEKADGYFEKLPDDVKVDEADRAVIAPYLAAMHELNLTPAQVGKLVAVRNQELETMVEQRTTQDNTLRTQTEDALRKEWGNDYRSNINNIHTMLSGAPEEVRDAIMHARTPDGTPLVGTPETVRWLAQLARQMNPFGTIVGPAGDALDGKGVEARISELNRWMGAPNGSADYKRYWGDPKVQAEYRELLDAQARMRQRAA